MSHVPFKPHHINATPDDLKGNNGIGRYILLPGSEGRAKEIAELFENLTVKSHQREHNLYLGTIQSNGKTIDIATIASGMGCPSMEIILHELFHLGAKRFLRVGTAGTLQPGWIEDGSLINVQASVRDEDTTTHYEPIEIPAIASLEFINAIQAGAKQLGLQHVFTGIVHCKSSLFARELEAGPKANENQQYLKILSESGILATEMETATLFIQSQLYNYQLMKKAKDPQHHVLAGAILTVIGTSEDRLEETPMSLKAKAKAINLAIESIKILANQEVLL